MLKMPLISVRVNPVESDKNTMYIDPISKFFIFLECVFGLERISVRRKNITLRLMMFIYNMIILSSIVYIAFYTELREKLNLSIYTTVMKYIICLFCCWLLNNPLRCYYIQLNNFDNAVGCRPSLTSQSIYNLIQMCVIITSIICIYVIPSNLHILKTFPAILLPFRIIYVIELGYYGHLLSLITPRLKLINYHIESTMNSKTSESQNFLKEFTYLNSSNLKQNRQQNGDMGKIMDVYEIIVRAHEYLIDSLKWQFLVSIVLLFISLLNLYFQLSMYALDAKVFNFDLALNLSLALMVTTPLLAPCAFGDCIQKNVQRFRELLAAKLYENRLDKSGRCIVRALLDYTESRNLSFRVLRVLNIDISLPFKFISLLITYLIIMLQFDKVIDSSAP